MLGEEQSQVKLFDELYSELCDELKKNGQSIDLCEKLRSCTSEESCVQTVLSFLPSVVTKFINSIDECFERKDEAKARSLFVEAKSMPCEQSRKAIKVLNNALLFAPFGETVEKSNCEEKLRDDGKLDLEWFLGMSVSTSSSSSGGCSKSPDQNDKELDGKECEDKLLVSKIYSERASRFNYIQEHESCILDIFTAIYYGAEKTFELAFSLAQSYKGLGYSCKANLIFQHSIELLRLCPKTNNQTKSEATLRIVKQLKEIKSMNRSNEAATGVIARGEDISRIAIWTKNERMEEEGHVEHSRSRASPTSSSHCSSHLSNNNNKNNGIRNRNEMNLYCGSSSQLIAASDALQLQYNSQFGRHVIAKKPIPAGKTLILEYPYSWSLCPKYYKEFCQQCCKRAKSWTPCQHCSAVVYCSWSCREEAKYIHKFECSILKLLSSSSTLGEMVVLCFRTISGTLLSTLMKHFSRELQHDSEDRMDAFIRETEGLTTTTTGNNGDGNGNRNDKNQTCPSSSPSCASTLLSKDKVNVHLGLNMLGVLDPNEYISAYAQSTNLRAGRPSGDILKRVLASVYLTLCLRFTGFFDYHSSSAKCQLPYENNIDSQPSTSIYGNKIDDGIIRSGRSITQSQMSKVELGITALLFRHLQSSSCNAYGINALQTNEEEDLMPAVASARRRKNMTLVEIGGGCYPTISLTNHSCNPNIYRYNKGKLCVVKSILDISEGEQLLDSYSSTFTTSSKDERQQLLLSNYFFDCYCVACANDWPVYAKLNANSTNRIDLPDCQCTASNIKVSKRKSSKKNKNVGSNCTICQLTNSVKVLEEKYFQYKNWLINEERSRIEFELESVESTLSSYISSLQSLYLLPEKRIIECQEMLKVLWNHHS